MFSALKISSRRASLRFLYLEKSNASVAIVNQLENAFNGRDIQFIRDTSEMNYKDSIRDFMKRLGRGKCPRALSINAHCYFKGRYLESGSCMFELTEIAARGDMRDRVFPIVLDDAQLSKPIKRLQYVKKIIGRRRREELDVAMKEVGAENREWKASRETIDLYAKIRRHRGGHHGDPRRYEHAHAGTAPWYGFRRIVPGARTAIGGVSLRLSAAVGEGTRQGCRSPADCEVSTART